MDGTYAREKGNSILVLELLVLALRSRSTAAGAVLGCVRWVRNKQESSPVRERSSFDRQAGQAETLVDSVGSAAAG